MCRKANPAEPCDSDGDSSMKQTFEIRSADASADVYMLLAGIAVALRHGFEMPDALKLAENTYVDVDIHKAENASRLASLNTLPADCAASADALDAAADIFSARGVFSPGALKAVSARLRSFDREESRRALSDPELMLRFVAEFFHCG